MQDLGTEILIYDLSINKAFCLNQTSATVFRNCDGNTSFADLRRIKRDLSDEVIDLTLDLLQKENLLKSKDYQPNFNGLSRREVIRKVGLGTMIALPVITSLIAPKAVEAQSSTCFNQPCVFANFTQSDCCNSNFRCSNSTSPSACTTCFVSGDRYFFSAPNANDAFCNAQSSKNICCNAGAATGDGSWCYCP